MEEEFHRLQMEREQQEQNLNLIVEQTGEVRHITIQINEELKNQNLLLSDMQEHMDTIDKKLQKNVQNMEKLAQSKQGPLLLVSIILTILLVGLVYWIIL